MLNPFEERIVAELRRLNRTFQKVTSILLACVLGVPDRTVRDYLRRMEHSGLVHRPRGRCSGWVAA